MSIPEFNVARLLRHAYGPAPCRAEFRERLCEKVVSRVGVSPSAARWRRATWVALAASLIIGVGVAVLWSVNRAGRNPGSDGSIGADLTHGVKEGTRPPRDGAAPRDLTGPHREAVGEREPRESSDPPKLAVESPARNPQLSGVVVDAATGEPIRDARVAFTRDLGPLHFPEAAESEIHDAQGRFSLEKLETGKYAIYVGAEGYAVARKVGIEIGGAGEAPSLRFELNGGARIRGRVVDGATGQPVEGAEVVSETDSPQRCIAPAFFPGAPAGAVSRRTGGDGAFDFLHLSAGTQILHVTKEGYAPAWGAPIVIARGQERADVVLTLTAGGGIRGVVRGPDGQPERGVEVHTVLDATQRGTVTVIAKSEITDAEGNYSISHLPPGGFGVFVARPKTASRPVGPEGIRPAQVREGEWTRVDLGITNKSRLFGKLVSEKPLEGKYTLSIVPADTTSIATTAWKAAVLDAEGRFEFTDVDAGRQLVYLATPFATEVIYLGEADVPAGGEREVNYRVPSGRITGTVADATTNAPIPNAMVILLRTGGAEPEFHGKFTTNAHGKLVCSHLPAGRYEIVAFAFGSQFAYDRAEGVSLASDGDTKEVALRLPPGATIRIRVRDASGAAVPKAVVRTFEPSRREMRFGPGPQLTNQDGEFVVPCALLGRWSVVVERDGKKIGEGSIDASRQGAHSLEITAQP